MNKKILLTVTALSAALIFSSCSQAAVPSDTTAATSGTTATESSEETTESFADEDDVVDELEHYDHTFNPHCLSKVYVEKYGAEFEENYYRFCDAILAGEDSVVVDNKEYLPMFRNISRSCLPIAFVYAYFFDEDITSVGENTYKLEYSIPKDEYLKKVDEFKARVEYLIENAVLEDDSDLEKTIALYQSESIRLDYDYDALEDDFRDKNGLGVSPYRALMGDKGICQEIAGAYAYLLMQVGIDAVTCGALSKDCSSAHEWTIVNIDGNYYHCDVTFQCSDKYNLRYFGMNDEQRESEGDWDMPYNNIGDTNSIYHDDMPIEDARFASLWNCYTYFLDRDENTLYCYDDSGTIDSCYYEMSVA